MKLDSSLTFLFLSILQNVTSLFVAVHSETNRRLLTMGNCRIQKLMYRRKWISTIYHYNIPFTDQPFSLVYQLEKQHLGIAAIFSNVLPHTISHNVSAGHRTVSFCRHSSSHSMWGLLATPHFSMPKTIRNIHRTKAVM